MEYKGIMVIMYFFMNSLRGSAYNKVVFMELAAGFFLLLE